MQSTAQGYLVFELTHSPVYLGYVAFASGIPTWLFTLFGGVITDRMSRRNLMVITQSVMLVLAFILAALAFTHVIQPWHIIVLAFLLGIANAFDAPPRQAIVLDLVNRQHLANAVALNAAMFNMAVAIGPAIAGLAYAAFGPGWCFTINGISFIAVIIALVLMKLAPYTPRLNKASALVELKEGLRYVAANPSIRVVMLVVGMASLLGISYMTLIPAWAVDILKGDATTNGLLQSARGFGALLGALMIASLAAYRFKGRIVMIGMVVYPALLLVFAWVRVLPVALLLLMGIGWAFMAMTNTCNSLVQHLVKDELRGRVMGIYSLIFFGFMPIGSLLVGGLAQAVGSPITVEITAVLALVFAVGIWILAPHLRRLEG
jgi:MFS family permease